MDVFTLNIEFDPNSGAVNGSNVKTNTPDSTLGSTIRNAVDSAGVARTPQPQHLAANLGTGSVAPFEGASGVGAYAEAVAIGATALGYHAKASVHQSTAVGNQAAAVGYRTIAVGAFANATMPNAIAIGSYAYAPFANSVAIGNGAQTVADNMFVISPRYTDIRFSNRIFVNPAKTLVNNTTTEIFRMTMPNPGSAQLQVQIGIGVSDGTNTQSYSAIAVIAAIHDGSGYNSTITPVGATTQLGGGGSALAVTLSMTQPATDVLAFNIKSNSTVITPTSITCYTQAVVIGNTTLTPV